MAQLVSDFCLDMITGFETSMYDSIIQSSPDAIEHLSKSKTVDFLSIYKALYIDYFNILYNDLLKNLPENKNHVNLQMQLQLNARDYCQTLASICVCIHFNLDRTKLDTSGRSEFVKSIIAEFNANIQGVDIDAVIPKNSNMNAELYPLNKGNNIIEIDIISG